MQKWICGVCGYIYDEARTGTPFSALPDSWVCPLCSAPKSAFSPAGTPAASQTPASPSAPVEELKELSAGELSAVCSNLARGCEKQYKDREASLFRELADFFAAGTAPEPDADLDGLIALIRQDLEEGYPALNTAAVEASDRGTQRICVWGEKVTRMLDSLLTRYRTEGESFLQNTQVWVCTVCGFVYVGQTPPEICPVCKVPAWKFEKMEGRV